MHVTTPVPSDTGIQRTSSRSATNYLKLLFETPASNLSEGIKALPRYVGTLRKSLIRTLVHLSNS